jgi:hypothetical protein
LLKIGPLSEGLFILIRNLTKIFRRINIKHIDIHQYVSMKTCPGCFKILSDRSRAKIISYLQNKKRANVKKINSLFRLRQPTISHHLIILKKAGILKSKKIGKEVYYSLDKNYSCSRCQIFKLPRFK